MKTDGGWDVRAGVAAWGKGKHLDRKGRIVYECRDGGQCRRRTETEGKTEHTDSFDTTYLKQGRRCMQRRIRWRQVHSDRMKNDVRGEGIVLSIVSWRRIFGKTDRKGDGQERRQYDDETDIEMDEIERETMTI